MTRTSLPSGVGGEWKTPRGHWLIHPTHRPTAPPIGEMPFGVERELVHDRTHLGTDGGSLDCCGNGACSEHIQDPSQRGHSLLCGAAAVLLLVPVALYFWFIHRYGVNAIYYDQWNDIALSRTPDTSPIPTLTRRSERCGRNTTKTARSSRTSSCSHSVQSRT